MSNRRTWIVGWLILLVWAVGATAQPTADPGGGRPIATPADEPTDPPPSPEPPAFEPTEPPVPSEPTPPVVGQVLGKVKVAHVELEGLSLVAARAKLLDELLPKLGDEVTLTDGRIKLVRSRQDLAAQLNLDGMIESASRGAVWTPLMLTVKRADLTKYLSSLRDRFTSGGQNARVVDTGDRVYVDEGAMKSVLDVQATATAVADALEKNAATRTLQVVVEKTPQAVPASVFAGINSRLARFTTTFNAREIDRTHNMKLAAATIDGVLAPPGVVFSMNEAVGERTAARGFRKAKIFAEGKIVQGLGGGVSQVTGTLFNAALFAGLKIVSYRTHSRPVAYLPIGRDATVAWGQFDMKFLNNSGAPVYIRYTLTSNRLTCTLYGRAPAAERKVTLEVTQRRLGARRINAALYRITKSGGKSTREHVGNSAYNWQPDTSE